MLNDHFYMFKFYFNWMYLHYKQLNNNLHLIFYREYY